MRTAYGKLGYISRISIRLLDQVNRNTKDFDKSWIHNLDFVITKDLVGKKLVCFNGNSYWFCQVTKEHVGFKLGSFIYTRQRVNHLKVLKGNKKR